MASVLPARLRTPSLHHGTTSGPIFQESSVSSEFYGFAIYLISFVLFGISSCLFNDSIHRVLRPDLSMGLFAG